MVENPYHFDIALRNLMGNYYQVAIAGATILVRYHLCQAMAACLKIRGDEGHIPNLQRSCSDLT